MPITRVKIERGKVSMDGEGFVGEGCRKAHEPYVQRLRPRDSAIAEEITKPEMHETTESEQTLDQA